MATGGSSEFVAALRSSEPKKTALNTVSKNSPAESEGKSYASQDAFEM